jgi:hypothetical protein
VLRHSDNELLRGELGAMRRNRDRRVELMGCERFKSICFEQELFLSAKTAGLRPVCTPTIFD